MKFYIITSNIVLRMFRTRKKSARHFVNDYNSIKGEY